MRASVTLLLGALLAALTTLVGGGGSAQAATRAADDEPLQVRIDTLTPSRIVPGSQGDVVVTGTVTNRDDVPWTTVNLYPFVSSAPLTTAEQLAAAVQGDDATPVGARITDRGPAITIDSLEPGESADYRIEVPQRLLGLGGEGVYWFGVHALGQGPDGRDDAADGRARTLLPLLGSARTTAGGVTRVTSPTPLPVSIVLPLRERVAYDADGRVGRLREWTALLRPEGRLDRLVRLSREMPQATWLIDPAVLDAVAQIAAGDPARSLASNLKRDGEPSPSASPDPASPSDSPSASASSSPSPSASATPDDDVDPVVARAAAAAQRWLPLALEALRDADSLLALPYGDPDLSAAARNDPSLYTRAHERTTSTLADLQLAASPAVSSPTGYLSREALALVDDADVVVLGDRSVRRDDATETSRPLPTVVRTDDRTALLSSSAAESGGPGPEDPLSDVGLRQRILSEAALRVLAPGPSRPLLVTLPPGWSPRRTAQFSAGLRQPWTQLQDVASMTSGRSAEPLALSRLQYPDSQVEAELGRTVFSAAESMIRAGRVLDAILPLNDRIARVVEREAMATVSYGSRVSRGTALVRARTGETAVRRTLSRVRISGPKGVTLSSASGRFAATVVNDLPVPVSVRIDAVSDRPLDVALPDSVSLPPRSRTTVLLDATTEQAGVHNLTLMLVDGEDRPIGSRIAVPIRSAQVSMVIWLILGVGLVLLFGTVALRTVRRLRARARRGASSTPTDVPEATA